MKLKILRWPQHLSHHVRRFGSWHSWFAHSWTLLHLWSHFRGHNTSLSRGSTWSFFSKLLTHHLLKSNSFEILLVFNLLFDILVSLKKFVVLSFSKLQSFIEVCLKFLLQSIHLILLLLNKFSFGSDDFLMSFLHVLFSFS